MTEQNYFDLGRPTPTMATLSSTQSQDSQVLQRIDELERRVAELEQQLAAVKAQA